MLHERTDGFGLGDVAGYAVEDEERTFEFTNKPTLQFLDDKRIM